MPDRKSWKTMLIGFIDEKQSRLNKLKDLEQTPETKKQIESLREIIQQHQIDHCMEENREDYDGRIGKVQRSKTRYARELQLAAKNEKRLG